MTDMTSAGAMPQGAVSREGEGHPTWLITLTISILGVFVMSASNLIDPMIRFDDYPALFADPDAFWHKTKDEGRWLNYWWHLRGVETPAWLNFSVYQVTWAVFAACLATAVVGKGKQSVWFATVMSLAIMVAPPATLISLWFNTLIPGLGLIALYAALGLVTPRHTHRLLLVPFTILTFMAYTTYPILLLIVALARAQKRSFWDLIGVLAFFTASFIAAVVVVFTINLQVHGVFGVPVADWRAATPATDWPSLVLNFPLVTQSFSDLLSRSSFDFAPAVYFHLGFLVLSTLVIARNAPLEALYLWGAMITGLTLVVAQILKIGVVVPPRTYVFAWVVYAILITRAAQILTCKGNVSGRLARNAVLLIIGSYMLQTFKQYGNFRDWQAETRALGDAVQTVEGPLALSRGMTDLPSAQKAFIQDDRAMLFRLQQLTGKFIPLCEGAQSGCCQPALRTNDCPTLIKATTTSQGGSRIEFIR